MVEFNPTQEILEGVDVVWQIPPNPKGVLYLAHSMNGSPFSYWPSHPNVPQCTGTPEHKVVTKDALERGFAVIAGTSVTNEWETWPPSTVDIQNAVKILKAWTRDHGLEDLPLSAWGTSCGGDYVSSLATVIKMHSLIVMISNGHPEAFKAAVPGEYPPTLFVPMINDQRTFSGVKEHVEVLREKGISCAIQEAPPLKIHPHYLAENIDELDEDQAAKLHSLFLEDGILAEDNSLAKVLLTHEIEPYLRKAGILSQVDDLQDEQSGGGPPHAGRRGGPPDGGRSGGRGPPSTRGEAPPAGGGRGRGQPPSLRGESPPAGGPPSARGEEAPPAGGRGQPPSLRGEAPPAGGRGGGRGGRGGRGVGGRGGGPPSNPVANGIFNQLLVAQGNHTLTARHNAEVFAWLEGKGWPNAQTQ